MNGNQKSKYDYVSDTLTMSIICMSLYLNLFFKPLENFGYTKSVMVFCCTFFAFTILGLLLTLKHQRNSFSSLCIQIASCFCYTVKAYYQYKPGFFKILFRVSLFVVVFLTVLLFYQRGKIKFKMKQGILNAYRIIAFTSVFAISFAGISSWKNDNPKDTEAFVSEETIAKNIDELQGLDDEKWSSMASEEKIKVLQIIADIEVRYLGISHRLNVQSGSLEERTVGQYSENAYSVAIDLEQLEKYDSMKYVEVICHEAYHSYQYELVNLYYDTDENKKNLYIFRNIKKYEDEFKNYIKGHEDFYAYYTQRCEEDSREYAESAVCDYYKKIFGSEYHGYDMDIDYLAELLKEMEINQ